MCDVLLIKGQTACYVFALTSKGRLHLITTYDGCHVSAVDCYIKLNADAAEETEIDLKNASLEVEIAYNHRNGSR